MNSINNKFFIFINVEKIAFKKETNTKTTSFLNRLLIFITHINKSIFINKKMKLFRLLNLKIPSIINYEGNLNTFFFFHQFYINLSLSLEIIYLRFFIKLKKNYCDLIEIFNEKSCNFYSLINLHISLFSSQDFT